MSPAANRRSTDPLWQVVDHHGTPHGAPRDRRHAEALLHTLRTFEPSFQFHLVAT